jgi:hypothetical protein
MTMTVAAPAKSAPHGLAAHELVLLLETDPQREIYIREFWRRRDLAAGKFRPPGSMEADLFVTEGHDDRVFALYPKPPASHRDLQRPRINRLEKAVPERVVHLKEAADDGVTELPLDNDSARAS